MSACPQVLVRRLLILVVYVLVTLPLVALVVAR